LDASGTSVLVIDNLAVAQLLPAASTQTLGGHPGWTERLNLDIDKVATLEAYRQAFETYRHFANLRFVALTAFIAITGGLFAVALKNTSVDTDSRDDRARFKFLMVAGLAIAANFWARDWRIDQLMKDFIQMAFALAADLNMSDTAKTIPPKTIASYISVVEVTWMVYAGSIVAWVVAGFLKLRKKQSAMTAQQIVGPERGERVSQLDSCGDS
jgi:hypothetical protein